MPVFQEPGFHAHLKEKAPLPLYLIYGEETHMVRWYARQTQRMILGDQENDFNFASYSAENLEFSQLFFELDSLSPFGDRRLIRVSDLQAEGMKKEQQTQWKELLQSTNEDSTLLIVGADGEVDYKKSAGWKSFASLVEKAGGGVIFCEKKTLSQRKKFLIDRCAKQGAILPPEVADLLLAGGIDDLISLGKEADKLSAWAGVGNTITKEAVEKLSPPRSEATVYQMAGDLAKANPSALAKLQLLFSQKVEPFFLLNVLGAAFVDLYRARLALDEQVSLPSLTQDFYYPANRSFVPKNALRDCQQYSLSFLRQAVREVALVDQKLKSTGLDGKILIEELAVRLLALAKQSR